VTDPRAIAWEVMEYLLAQLRDADLSSVNVAPAEMHLASGALFGFERSGLFDEQQVEEWRERINAESQTLMELMRDETEHRVAARLLTPPPSVEPASAEQVLEQQLQDVERRQFAAAMSGRSLHPAANSAHEAACVLLHALAELGLVDELGERQWGARFDRAADPNAEPLHTYSAGAIAADVALVRAADAIPEVAMPLVHPMPDCTLDELVTVLMVRAPAGSFARIESLVIYADGTVITATTPPAERGRSHPPPTARVTGLTDDLGTYYFPRGGGGGSGGTQRGMSRYVFAPAIVPGATELRISIGDEQFVIALPAR
jgi:hypothetical protein